MHLEGTRRLASPPEAVCAAANELEFVRRCLPGCERLERLPDDRLAATLHVAVDGRDAPFVGTFRLARIDPPNEWQIEGQCESTTTGSVRGHCIIRLTGEGNATGLAYAVDVTDDARPALSGASALLAAAHAYVDDAMTRFAFAINQRAEGVRPGATLAGKDAHAAVRRSLPPMAWVPGLIAVVLAMLIIVARL